MGEHAGDGWESMLVMAQESMLVMTQEHRGNFKYKIPLDFIKISLLNPTNQKYRNLLVFSGHFPVCSGISRYLFPEFL